MNSNSPSSVGRVQQFVRSHLIETITVTIAGSFLLTGVSVWHRWKINQGFQSTIAQQFELEKSSLTLVVLQSRCWLARKANSRTNS